MCACMRACVCVRVYLLYTHTCIIYIDILCASCFRIALRLQLLAMTLRYIAVCLLWLTSVVVSVDALSGYVSLIDVSRLVKLAVICADIVQDNISRARTFY